MKYLHQVSYLRLQDVIGVCLSYCCLSGTTCACRSPILRSILLSIRYNAYTCHSPIYHYIIATVVYLVYCTCHSCVCRGSVIIELVSRMNIQRGRWVCWKSKKTCFLESGLMRNTYTRYHVCLMRVFIILMSIPYNVCVCHSPVYHYIIATAASHNVS